jgi:undecaprenyl pyrophosphate phosphatase UppP
MQFFYHWILSLSGFLRPHLGQVALSLAATILFLYGEQIHGVVKGLIKELHFIFRLLILVLVCAFGYGTLAYAFTKLCEAGLRMLDNLYLAPVIIGVFLVIGLLAERKKAM